MESRGDVNTAQQQVKGAEAPMGEILGEAAITIDVPVATAFAFWRHLENLPQFMQHVNEVKEISPNCYRWSVDGPAGTAVTWDAKTTKVVENSTISWQSTQDSEVVNSGSVHFSPKTPGSCEIRVKLAYTPPAGKLGHLVASMLGKNPEQQIGDDLKTLKSLLTPGAGEAN